MIDRHGNLVLRKGKNKYYSLSLKEEMTLEEKNAYNEERILYLEAENEYLKKLRAVVQARKNRLPKKK